MVSLATTRLGISLRAVGKVSLLIYVAVMSALLIALSLQWNSALPKVLSGSLASDQSPDWLLFRGAELSEGSQQRKAAGVVPVSRPRVDLVGIVGSEGARVVLAKVASNPVRTFTKGEFLDGIWEISEIHADGILVSHAGERWYQSLRKFNGDSVGSISSPNEISSGMEQLGLKVVRNRSGERGVAVADVDAGILRELRLEPTDILLTVSEVEAADILSSPLEYRYLLTQPQLDLVVFRNKQRITVEVSVTQLLRVVTELEKG